MATGVRAMEFDWGPILSAFVAVTLAAGGVTRWLVSRMDRMHDRDQKMDADARDRLQTLFSDRIDVVRAEFETRLRAQSHEVEFLKSELHRYIKHVGVLEGILKSHQIDIPPIEPPPVRHLR